MPIMSTVRIQIAALDDPCFKIKGGDSKEGYDVEIYKTRVQRRVEKIVENYKNIIKNKKDKDTCDFRIHRGRTHKGDIDDGSVYGNEEKFIKKLCKDIKFAINVYFLSSDYYCMQIYEYNPQKEKKISLLKEFNEPGDCIEIGLGECSIDYNRATKIPHEVTKAFYEQDYFNSKNWKHFFTFYDYPAHIEGKW
jgi:hypothetical protein